MNRVEMTAALATRPIDSLWRAFSARVRTLQPFWIGTTRLFATRTGFPGEKLDAHLATVVGAFDSMDNWRFERVRLVKARRNEIDSAISFIRNKALERSVAGLRAAPAARNAASALRVLLCAACRGYADHQLSELAAGSLYKEAAVRIAFPFDFGTLMSFHPGHDFLGGDPFTEMLERAAAALSIQNDVRDLMAEAGRLWAEYDSPTPIVWDERKWSEDINSRNADMHRAAIRAFHDRAETD